MSSAKEKKCRGTDDGGRFRFLAAPARSRRTPLPSGRPVVRSSLDTPYACVSRISHCRKRCRRTQCRSDRMRNETNAFMVLLKIIRDGRGGFVCASLKAVLCTRGLFNTAAHVSDSYVLCTYACDFRVCIVYACAIIIRRSLAATARWRPDNKTNEFDFQSRFRFRDTRFFFFFCEGARTKRENTPGNRIFPKK